MRTMIDRIAGITLGAMLLLMLPIPASAQLEQLMNPTLGQVMPRAEYRYTFYPERDVEGQSARFGVTEHRVSLTTPIHQNSTDEFSLSASVKFQDVDTHAIFPHTGDQFPKNLWDIRLSPASRHQFENGWSAGVAIIAGPASDEPFNSEHELIVRATSFLRVPSGERNAWIFMLNYTNVSDFLGGIPLPGLAYVYSPSDTFTAVIGLPFTIVQAKPAEKLELEFMYTAIQRIRARATYAIFRPLRVWTGFEWDYDVYLRADRQDYHDRLFYYEKRLGGGVRFDLRHIGFEVAGGYAFDRFYFEADSYSNRDRNRLDVGNAPFVVGRINVRF